MKTKYKLFLINPRLKYPHYGTQVELSHFVGKKKLTIPLALPIIASLTPDNYKIKIIDEDIDLIPKNERPDLVAIVALIATIERSYEIADMYRGMGVTVVMGGPYATFKADEVLKHADSVIIGEVENKWQDFIFDFEKGEVKKRYEKEKVYEFKTPPIPRWDLVNVNKIMTVGVQASRGCPYNCEFCLVTKMFGRKQRYRDIDNLINEIGSLPTKRIFFVDDNLTFDKKYSKEFMKRLIPLKTSWVCQSSIDVADDEELLELMADAGCLSILIGFESLNPESLKETRKFHNKISNYEGAIEKIHSKGIHVLASFVLGFDADTLKDFDYIYDFIQRNNLLFIMLSMLTVSPGIDLYDRIKKEGRLYDIEPHFINGVFPCYSYKNISPIEMVDRFYGLLRKVFYFDDKMYDKAMSLFRSGAFYRECSDEVGIIEKIVISYKILKTFYFTKDKIKKKLFKDLFSLGIQKKLGMDKIVFFLTSMAGFTNFMDNSKESIEFVKEKIKRDILHN